MKREFIAAITMMLLTAPASQAAIAVVDAQNIAQTAKVYAESVKTVMNTAQQIQLQAQELLSLPTNILEQYTSAYTNMINDVNNTVSNATYNFITRDVVNQVEEYWGNKFGTLEIDVVTTEKIQQQEKKRREDTTAENKKYTQAYSTFLDLLNTEGKKLADLLKKSNTAAGQKQNQQIANQIAACRANIARIQSNIHLMNSKRQLEAQERTIALNTEMANLAQAKAQATTLFIEKLDVNGKRSIESFWKKD